MSGASAPVPLPLHSRVCSSCTSVLFFALAPPARRSCRPRRTSRPPPPAPLPLAPLPAPLPPRRGQGGVYAGRDHQRVNARSVTIALRVNACFVTFALACVFSCAVRVVLHCLIRARWPRCRRGGVMEGRLWGALGDKPHFDSFDTHACLSTC